MTRQGAAETPQTAPPDASRHPRLSPLYVGAHSDAPHPRDSAGAGRGADKRTCGGTANADIHSTGKAGGGGGNTGGADGRAGAREQIRGAPFQRRGRLYPWACLVYHEARGESFEGQVAVVEVVLNRMLSDYFPDTGRGGRIFRNTATYGNSPPLRTSNSADPDKEQYLAVLPAIEEREQILSEDTVYFSTAPCTDCP